MIDRDENWYGNVETILARHDQELEDVLCAGTPQGGPERRPAPNWRTIDPTIAAAELNALDAWVQWFVTRYNLSSLVPPCWTQHPPMVEELSALYAAWRGAYGDPAANADAGLAWHEQLDRWRVRWPNWNLDNCNVNIHRPTIDVGWYAGTASR